MILFIGGSQTSLYICYWCYTDCNRPMVMSIAILNIVATGSGTPGPKCKTLVQRPLAGSQALSGSMPRVVGTLGSLLEM